MGGVDDEGDERLFVARYRSSHLEEEPGRLVDSDIPEVQGKLTFDSRTSKLEKRDRRNNSMELLHSALCTLHSALCIPPHPELHRPAWLMIGQEGF